MQAFYLNKIKGYLDVFLSYFLFTPAITFGIVNAGVFPYAFLYSLVNIKILAVEKNKYFIFYFFGLVFSALISIFILVNSNNFNQFTLIEVIRSLFSLINGPIVFFTLLLINFKEILKLERIIFILFPAFIAIGLLQHFNFFVNPSTFKIFIPNSIGYNLDSIARGVSGLQSEPARYAFDLIFMAIIIKIALIKRYENFHFLFDFFILFVIYYINKSLTGIIYTILFILTFNNLKSLIKLIVPLIFFVFTIYFFDGDSRAFFLIDEFLTSPESFWRFIYNNSGFRVIGIISVIPEIIRFPFGVSVGLWREHQSLINLSGEIAGFVKDNGAVAVKIPSFIFELIYDFGILSSFLFHFLFKGAKKIFKVLPLEHLYFFLFTFIFSDTVGDPLPWISLAMLYRKTLHADK